jgi:hypothetical protein
MFLRQCLAAAAAIVFCLAPDVLLAAPSAPPTFEAGEGAYIAGKFDEARAIYEATAASRAASPKDRAASLRQLGVMAWRLAGDNATAARRLDEALHVGADRSRTHVARARFYAAAKRFDEAGAAGEAAIATASNAPEQSRAALAYAHAVLAKLHDVPVARQSRDDETRLARAREVIGAVAKAPPLPLDLSEALLEVALRLDDGPLALMAWRSYAREGNDTGAWAPASRRLSETFPRWRRGTLAPALRADVFEALATSQFFDLAVMVARDDRIDGTAAFLATPRTADVVAYAAMLDETRTTTEAYYRDVAGRKANAGAWRSALIKSGQDLWAKLQFTGPRAAFAPEALAAELDRRFGAYINIGETGGVDDLHYGHIFIDDARTIDQYGHRAQIRRVALDRIVSNGYESWVWDGRQAHGGWATNDRVYQVRPGYADGALEHWDLLNDPKLRAEEEQRIARLTPGDDDIARQDPAAYLPGLAGRLDWQGENAILDGLLAQGPHDLKQRFIVAFMRIGLDANFFAHEGRHVLDKQAFGKKLDSEELEFRAKLSEIAFSEQPCWSFGPIMNPNIADKSSPHGRANRRIMQGLVAWMDKNRASIAALDPARPLLPQFDKLTDDQMRAAMRAMDPWAPK